MKAAVMSFLAIAAVVMGSIGVYSTQASADRATDGYGITSSIR